MDNRIVDIFGPMDNGNELPSMPATLPPEVSFIFVDKQCFDR